MTTPLQMPLSITSWEKPPSLRDYIFIRTNNLINKVKLIDIKWIHADGNYSYIYTNDRRFVVKISLKRLFSKLASTQFIRVHKSYAIHINAIDKIDTHLNIVYVSEKKIPVGRVFKMELLKCLDVL